MLLTVPSQTDGFDLSYCLNFLLNFLLDFYSVCIHLQAVAELF
jgi:hypothetical protein